MMPLSFVIACLVRENRWIELNFHDIFLIKFRCTPLIFLGTNVPKRLNKLNSNFSIIQQTELIYQG